MTWLSWGFGEKEIQLAYEKTCMNTGGLKWPYLNSILKSWHEQGFTTLAQIDAATASRQRPRSRATAYSGHGDKLTELEREAIAA